MIQALLALLLIPFLLLIGGACAIVLWESLASGWHSGAVPMALGCVVLGFGLLLIPGRGQKWRRKPGDPR